MATDPRAGTAMTPQEQVQKLYLRDLNRQPDPGGAAFWEQRATQVSPAQLNAEFRAAAKTENPQAGSLATPMSRMTLPGDPGWQEQTTSLLDAVKPFVVPIIAIAAPALIPTIGSALGATTVAGQAALGSAVVNAGVTAATGGSLEDIARSAAGGAAGGYLGTTAGEAVKGTAIANALPQNVASSAAGSAVGTTAQRLVETGDVGQALKEGAISGLGSGLGQGVSVKAQELLPESVSPTTRAVVAGLSGGGTEAAVIGQNPITGALGSALQTARLTAAQEAEAARTAEEARRQQVISAFEQPTTPSTQFGSATAAATPATLPGYTTTEFDTPEFTASGRPIAGRFDPTIVGGEETLSPSDRLALDELRRAAITGDVQTLREVTQTGGLPTTTPSTAINPVLASTTGFTTRQPSVSTAGGALSTTSRTPTGTSSAGGGLTGQTTTNRDQQILNLTGIAKPTDTLPGIDVTGQDELDRLPNVDVTGEEELETTTKLTDDTLTPIIKQPPIIDDPTRIIDYRYFNVVDPTFSEPPITTTTMGPGTSALAQALGVGDPGVSYLSKKGKERKPVWNVESLKLSDELGGRYG